MTLTFIHGKRTLLKRIMTSRLLDLFYKRVVQ